MAEQPEKTYPAPPAGAHTRWRTTSPRYPVDTSASIHLIDLAIEILGHISDVSLGGCHVRTDRRFPVGIYRRVEVEFRLEGLPFRLAGVTQALYDPLNVGIRFLDLSDRKRRQLAELIEEIKKEEQEAAAKAAEHP